MSSLLKKLSISIKIHVVKPLWSLFGHWSVSKLLTESVGSRRELVANCVYDADATQLDSYVASASAVCIGHALNTRASACRDHDWSTVMFGHCSLSNAF